MTGRRGAPSSEGSDVPRTRTGSRKKKAERRGAGNGGARASTWVARTPWWRGKASPACRQRCRTVCVHVQVVGWRARGGEAARERRIEGGSVTGCLFEARKKFRARKLASWRGGKKTLGETRKWPRKPTGCRKTRKAPNSENFGANSAFSMAPKNAGTISAGPENFGAISAGPGKCRGHFGWPRRFRGQGPENFGARGHWGLGNFNWEIQWFITQEKRENAFPAPGWPRFAPQKP